VCVRFDFVFSFSEEESLQTLSKRQQ